MGKEGFWVAQYQVSGTDFRGFGLLTMDTGLIVGADYTGAHWDGCYTYDKRNDFLEIELTISVPSGSAIPAGQVFNALSGAPMVAGYQESFQFTIPNGFERHTFPLQSQLGSLEVTMQKIRDWPE